MLNVHTILGQMPVWPRIFCTFSHHLHYIKGDKMSMCAGQIIGKYWCFKQHFILLFQDDLSALKLIIIWRKPPLHQVPWSKLQMSVQTLLHKTFESFDTKISQYDLFFYQLLSQNYEVTDKSCKIKSHIRYVMRSRLGTWEISHYVLQVNYPV